MTEGPPAGLTPRQVAALRQMLSTNAGMARFLNELFGPSRWTCDPAEDVWVVAEAEHQEPGRRGFLVVQRGGDWFRAVVPVV